MADLFRLFAGVVVLALASLTVLPAPNRLLWGASVAATEYGYWIALAALVPLIPTRKQTFPGRLGGLFCLASIPLLMFPVYRAHEVGDELQRTFEGRFGADRRVRARSAQDPRIEPFVLRDLVVPADVPAVRYEQRVFVEREDQKLSLDIYRPGYVHEPVPAVIVVHGGAWQHGDNTEFAGLNAYLASRDYVVAAINYRLAPRWRFPAQRDDVFAAMAYVKTHAGDLNVDPSRLVLMGRSEGGQLALLAAYTSGEPSIRGVISIYAPTDLRYQYEHPSSSSAAPTRTVIESFVGGPPARAEQAYFDASPINFVTPATPPTLLIHGLRDPVISADQSGRLDERLQKAGVKHVFVRLPWATHACDTSLAGPCGQITTYSVERFLDAVTIGPAAPAPSPAHRTTKLAKR
jgi:acetyl esterase/lipase